MTAIAASDWDALTDLSRRVGLPEDRVSALRRRLEPGRERPGSPYTVLVGRPDAGLEKVVGRWLGAAGVDALEQAGGRPLVIGPHPLDVRPRLGSWPGLVSDRVPEGHLIVLRLPGPPPADVLAQLGSLGLIEQVVLVTRLFQAMHESERRQVESLAPLAATARVLLVVVPGEEPTAADLDEVPTYARTILRGHGYDDGRALTGSIWYAGDSPPFAGAIASPADALAVDAVGSVAGRDGMARAAVAQALGEIRGRANSDVAPAATVPAEERIRLIQELNHHLTALGREVARMAEARRGVDAAFVRDAAVDLVRGWGAYTSIEGHWLKYVNHLRPGLQDTLLEQVRIAAAGLDYVSPGAREARPVAVNPARSGVADALILEALRVAVGLALGVSAYLLVARHVPLPPVADVVVQLLALAVATVLGYALGRRFFPTPAPRKVPPRDDEVIPAATDGLQGWPRFQGLVTSWFASRIDAVPSSPLDECKALARRLGIPEDPS